MSDFPAFKMDFSIVSFRIKEGKWSPSSYKDYNRSCFVGYKMDIANSLIGKIKGGIVKSTTYTTVHSIIKGVVLKLAYLDRSDSLDDLKKGLFHTKG